MGFDLDLVEALPGLIVLRAVGKQADVVFRDEPGGHRWQRVPPTEKRGRVHTSTITVAILPEVTEAQIRLDPRDLEIGTCRGSGAGGQHRNKTESAVMIKHRPSGLVVRCETERSQHQNRATALALLRSRLWAAAQAKQSGNVAAARRDQVGSGMRGDKRRTIRCQDGVVTDHVTGRRWPLRAYERGEW
ncbi:Peptide chain release factor 1 [Minicystis rosea]|nr:Peptide chain release factor 1 [Minicystis rosea]